MLKVYRNDSSSTVGNDSPVLPVATLLSRFGAMTRRVDAVVTTKQFDNDEEEVLSSQQLLKRFEELQQKQEKLDSEVEKSLVQPR